MNEARPTHDSEPSDTLLRFLTALTLLGIVILMLWLSVPVFIGHVYVEDDLSASHIPLRTFYQRTIETENSFLWTPYYFNGFYLHGEGEAGMLHPLHVALYRLFPLDVGFMLELLASYPFMCIGMFLFLRRWDLAPHAALFGAMLFTFVGFNLNHYIHMHFVAIFAHLPWQLLAIDVAMRTRDPRTRVWAVFSAVGLSASQLFLGGPQPTYFSWLVESMYALALFASTRNVAVLMSLGVAKGLAILVAAAQLLPTLDVLRRSVRSLPSLEFQMETSLHPFNILQLASPYLFHRRVYGPNQGDQPWDAPYMGATAAVLVVLLIIRLRHLGREKSLAAGALFLIGLGALSSLGSYGFLYRLYSLIPFISEFRASARYVAIMHVGMSVGAAIAWGHLASVLREGGRLSWRQASPLLALPCISVLLVLGVVAMRFVPESEQSAFVHTFVMPTPVVLVGAGLVAVAAALVIAAARGSRAALLCLLVFTIADIAVYSLRHKPHEDYDEWYEAIEAPPPASWTKVEPDAHGMVINRASVKGYRGVSGYVSLTPAQKLDFSKELPMRLAGVTWRQVRFGTSIELNAAYEAGKKWVELPDAMPRVRLLTKAVVSDDPNEDIYAIDIARTALVGSAVELGGGVAGEAEIVEDKPGEIRVRAKTHNRQLLVTTESYHEGWHALVDGTQRPVIPAYGDFLALVVEAGSHEILFTFAPDSYRLGRRISMAATLFVLVLFGAAMSFAARKPVRDAGRPG